MNPWIIEFGIFIMDESLCLRLFLYVASIFYINSIFFHGVYMFGRMLRIFQRMCYFLELRLEVIVLWEVLPLREHLAPPGYSLFFVVVGTWLQGVSLAPSLISCLALGCNFCSFWFQNMFWLVFHYWSTQVCIFGWPGDFLYKLFIQLWFSSDFSEGNVA